MKLRIIFFFSIFIQTLFSSATAQVLVPLPNSPINTGDGGSQCTKNFDESYAVCAGAESAVKYNLQPFSFAMQGPNLQYGINSCDLYETTSQSTSRVVCVTTEIVVHFFRVSDMSLEARIPTDGFGEYARVVVDTPNQVAYVSNSYIPPAIYKLTSIGSSPIVAGNVTPFDFNDCCPGAMLIIDGFLYAHMCVDPARLARVSISTFTWKETVTFASGENSGAYDNLANDENYIYDLTDSGILVRCTYKNNNFARFDSLNTGLSLTYSLSISPDLRTLFLTSEANSVLQMVDTESFSILGNNVTVPSAFGRPIITSWCNIYVFSESSFSVYAFHLNSSWCRTLTVAHASSSTITNSITRGLNSSLLSQSRSAVITAAPSPTVPVTLTPSVPSIMTLESFAVIAQNSSITSYAVDGNVAYIGTGSAQQTGIYKVYLDSLTVSPILNIPATSFGVVKPNSNRAFFVTSSPTFGAGSPGMTLNPQVYEIDTSTVTPTVVTSREIFHAQGQVVPTALFDFEGGFEYYSIGSTCFIGAYEMGLRAITGFATNAVQPCISLSMATLTNRKYLFALPACYGYGGQGQQVGTGCTVLRMYWGSNQFYEAVILPATGIPPNFGSGSMQIANNILCIVGGKSFTKVDAISMQILGIMSTISNLNAPLTLDNSGFFAYVGTIGNAYRTGRAASIVRVNLLDDVPSVDSIYTDVLPGSPVAFTSAFTTIGSDNKINVFFFGGPIANTVFGSIVNATAYKFSADYSFRRTLSAEVSPSRSQRTMSVSCSMSLSISNSKSVTTTATSSYSSSGIDCRRMWNQSTCNRDGTSCTWCENIGACVNASESCSTIHCNSFSTVASAINNDLCPSSECHYCSKRKSCLNKTHDPTCSCVVASSSSDCAALGECFWCNTNISFFEQPPNSVNLCIDNNNEVSPESQECNCAFFPQHICNQTSSPCEWCDAVNSCIDPRIKTCENTRCTDFTPLILSGQCPPQKCGVCQGICVGNEFVGENCNPSKFDEMTCRGCHNCSWNLPIVLGVGDSNPYCVMSASPLNCESPPTCNGINSNEKEKRNQCEASGCKFDSGKNQCVNQDCFDFFLPGFLLQPFALTVFGFVKDFIVLLLIGVFGDSFMRFIRRRIIVPFSFWKNNWDRKRIIPNLDRTIYVNDTKCRDGTSERNESFEKYCDKIMNELFEFPTENNNNTEEILQVSFNGSPSIQDEKYESEKWKIKSKVLDAVAFSMYDSGLWFDLDNDGYCGITNSAATLSGYSEELLSEGERVAENIGDRMSDPGSHDVGDEQKNENQIEKVPLTETIIDNRVNLQKIVTAAITARATAVVFYASSRDPKTRAAAALNSFSSPMQLLFYLCGVLVLVIAAFYTVLGNEKNLAIVNRISSYTCDDTSNLASNSTSTSEIISAERRATFFLLGFRLMNSSTLATVMLLFVKTVRAIWASFRDRFFVMNLPQRLPIMSLYTKRSSQLLLLFYFLGVLPFALAGITYGLQVSGSVIVCMIAFVLLVLDVSILTVVRRITAKKEKEELAAARKKILDEELEAQGLKPEKETLSQVGNDFEAAKSQCVINNKDNDDILSRSNSNYNKRYDGTPRHDNDCKEQENETKSAQPCRINSGKFRSEILLQKMYGVEALPADGVENKGGWDEITADEALTTKRNSLTEAAPTTLAKALLVFFLSEELPTIILTLALQMCFNYMCLMEYKSSFGVNDQSEVPQLEFNSRKLVCVAQLFAHDVSAYINVFSSFFAYL